ncbi:MAG: toll/interleukin-1 receptor domain-containing protein [Gammaproteobacteria bacterium]|nr:toll/interleukin-1 receptor domain-containing protein [Gammaproteobacteria bacterium]
MSTVSETDEYRYQAFISYCHQDEEWGTWLHKALEGYRVPRYLVGKKTAHKPIPRRLTPIFRDRDELPTATDLGSVVNEALQQSACLIVICSPHAVHSQWVNQEILSFKRWGHSDRIFCLIVDGEPNAAYKPELEAEECFPDALRYVLGPDGELTDERTEPIAADVRPHGDGKAAAKLKLIAGLLGVGLDELKHREQHRRHQRMVAITATALAVMIVTTVLAINAIVAQGEAERRRAQAEDLISFMLGDLRERLEPIGRLEVLDSVGDKALEYFASLPDEDITDEALSKRAMALCQVGEVRVAQGKLDQAMSAFNDCFELARTLSMRAPNNGSWLYQLGQAHFWVGYVHWEQGNLDAVAAQFRQYLAISQQLIELDPDNSDWQLELSYAHNNLGTVLHARGNPDEASDQFRISIKMKESLVAAHPANNEWKVELADSYSWLGSMLQARGKLDQALELHRADVAITRTVLASNPANTDWQWRLSRALELQGDLLVDLGNTEDAMDKFEQALAISTKLVQHDMENTSWQRAFESAHARIGRVLWMRGDLSNALAHFRQTAAITEQLSALDASKSHWQRTAAIAHNSIGETLLSLGDTKAALQEVHTAIEIIEKLVANVADDRKAILVLGEAYMLLGRISAQTGTGEEPTVTFTRAVDILEPIANNGTTDKTFLDPWARALLHVDRIDDARPVVEKLHRMGFKGRQLIELCRNKGVLMEG